MTKVSLNLLIIGVELRKMGTESSENWSKVSCRRSILSTIDHKEESSIKNTIQNLANMSNRMKLKVIKSRAKARVFKHQE